MWVKWKGYEASRFDVFSPLEREAHRKRADDSGFSMYLPGNTEPTIFKTGEATEVPDDFGRTLVKRSDFDQCEPPTKEAKAAASKAADEQTARRRAAAGTQAVAEKTPEKAPEKTDEKK